MSDTNDLDSLKNFDLDFEKVLGGANLTTAELFYQLPDYPSLLQSYVWQEFDYPPFFPALKSFIRFWQNNLEGRLRSVKVTIAQPFTSRKIIMPSCYFELDPS